LAGRGHFRSRRSLNCIRGTWIIRLLYVAALVSVARSVGLWVEEGALIGALAFAGTIFSLFVFFKFWVARVPPIETARPLSEQFAGFVALCVEGDTSSSVRFRDNVGVPEPRLARDALGQESDTE
jgi:hypothetical protein